MRVIAFAVGLIFVAATCSAAIVGPDGVNALFVLPGGLVLDGTGIQIGSAEFGRSSKGGFDSDDKSADDTKPAGIFVQSHSGMALKDELVDFHATLVAQQMIGTGALTSGVSPGAALQSFSLSDQNDDSLVALGLNRLATLNSGQVRAINLSFVGVPGFFDAADGNSYFTQFVDWSAQRHDVLYVVAWGNSDELELVRKPADNFNGITVASSEQVGEDGPYRRFSVSTNFFEDDPFDAQRIDILAPGTNIPVTGWDENLSFVGGSSFAAPTVVGTVALMQQYAQIQRNLPTPNPRFDSDSERHQVMKAAILNSADKLSGVHGSERTVWDGSGHDWLQSTAYSSLFVALDPEMGAGHLNAKRAVEQLMPGEYDPGMIPKIG